MLDAEAKMDLVQSPTIAAAAWAQLPKYRCHLHQVSNRGSAVGVAQFAQSMFYCGGKVLGAVAPSHCSCFTVDALKKHHSTKDVQTHDTTWFL